MDYKSSHKSINTGIIINGSNNHVNFSEGSKKAQFHPSVIAKHFRQSEYVLNKLSIIHKGLECDTELAIGNAKEMLETVCKFIFQSRGKVAENKWDFPKLIKETTAILNLIGNSSAFNSTENRAYEQFLGCISGLANGIANFRNQYGSGHGKSPEFIQVDYPTAKYFVDICFSTAEFLVTINGKEFKSESSHPEL